MYIILRNEGFKLIEHVCVCMSTNVPEAYTDAPLDVKGNFPGLWWNSDRYEARRGRVEELEEKIPESDAVGIVDTDSDGLACETVLRSKYENPVVIQANSSDFGIGLTHALSIVSDSITDDTPVIVADLSPDTTFSSFKVSLSKIDNPTYVYDHHDWKWTARTSIECVVDELVIGDNKCAAQVLQEELYPEADDQLKEFLEVTADHDLWIKEDKRSDHLSALSFRLSREEYIEAAFEYGADMVTESKELQGIYGEGIRKAKRRAELAVENAERISVNGTDVAITYFDCHQSRVGDMLLEDGVDLAVIIQPTLSVSFRGTESFGDCAELARGLGGGGHPTAAGANLYKEINVPEKISVDSLAVPEFGETSEDVSLEDIEKHNYVWRSEGEPVIQFMKNYIQEKL